MHNVAGFIHIVAVESEEEMPKWTFSVNRTCGHVMLHKSDLRHFILQFTRLCACYKMPSGRGLRPCYASRA